MMKILLLYFSCILLMLTTTSNVLAQSEEKIFTSPKFGVSMKYPSDWSLISGDQKFTSTPYFGSVASFCPTSYVGSDPEFDCVTKSPVRLEILDSKLKKETTLKGFLEQELARASKMKSLVGEANIETKKVNVSGLSAIETTKLTGGGTFDKVLSLAGVDKPKGKEMTIYVVNGDVGYKILAETEDEQDFDTYYPTIQKMINSFQIQGAKESPENAAFVPTTKNAPPADVVLLSQRLKKGTGDYNDIVGQVKNLGSDTVDFVKIGLTVYDKKGDVIGTDSAYADATTLKPNQKSSFDILSSKDNFNGMSNYDLFLQWKDSSGEDQYVDNARVYKAQD